MYFDLTPKQIQVLEFIKEQIALKGYPPSVRETCDAVGLKSTSTVHSHLNTLEKLGYIRRDPAKPRAIEVINNNKSYHSFSSSKSDVINLPLIGQITAGEPILADENIEEYLPLPANLIKGTNNFILKVKGDSMINAGILNGDYIIVDKVNHANDGQIAVALVYSEYATVKKVYKEENDMIRLQPENEFMDPIILSRSNVEILGIVTGVFRVMK